MVRFPRASAAAVLVFLAGCSLFTDFSTFHEDDDDAGVAVEGGADAPTPSLDGAPGGEREAAATDGAPASPCSAPHKFCDDFDAPSLALPGKWSEMSEGNGPLSLDGELFVTGPRSLRVSVTPGMGLRSSYLETTFDTSAKIVELAYDLRVKAFSGTFDELDVGLIMFKPTPPGFKAQGLTIINRPNVVEFEYFRERNTGGFDTTSDPITIPNDTWKHIAMRIDVASVPPRGSLQIDGQEAASLTLLTNTLTNVLVNVGVTFSEDAQVSTQVNVDNVTIDEL